MTIDSDIRDQAYQFFIEEAPELLQEIESGILMLREARDTAKVHSIMRAAHSLKGGSASVGLDVIKTIAHRLETIFKALYSDTVTIDTELETQLLQAYDCLRLPLLEQLQYGQFDTHQALAIAEPILSQLEGQFSEAIAATADFIPSSEDLGMSMAQSIFEVDVAEGLERLATVIAHPSGQEVAGELRAQAEVFTGFAELLNLPGFGAIATAAIQALDRHPHQVLDIARLALEDFRAGRADVLSQPASQGGAPSAALLAMAQGAAVPGAAAERASWSLDEAAELLSQLGEDVDQDQVLAELGLVDLTAADNPVLPDPREVTGATSWGQALDELSAIAQLDLAFASTLDPGDSDRVENNLNEDSPNGDSLSKDNLNQNNLDRNEQTADSFREIDGSTLRWHEIGESVSELTEDGLSDNDLSIYTLEDNALADDVLAAPDQTAALMETRVRAETSLPVTNPLAPTTDHSLSLSATAAVAITPSSPSPKAVVDGLSVRVEADRLNRMNNLLGELTINRNGVELQNSQLRSSIKDLLSRFGRFQELVETLRVLSDQMLIAPERQQVRSTLSIKGSVSTSPGRSRGPNLEREGEFDSLEMDSYTQLYTQTQTLLEEIVQLEEAVEDVSLFSYQSEQLLNRHRKMLSQMQDELMWARMIPLKQVLNRFPRVLRDLSNTYHKEVELQLSGTDILLDKAVLSKLYDPLVQLLRNSFDHGIEPPGLRQQQGKSRVGHIEIRARHLGRQVIIEVRDDGQGLNFQRIRDRTLELGWLTPEDAQDCNEERLSQFIFEPGFSTAQRVSELSGRGVGLDIVRDQMRALNGSITVASSPGKGTVFTLALPLTLTIINLLICFVGSTPLAIRSDSIQEILIPMADQLRKVGSQQFLYWQGEDIPTYSLAALLKYHCLVPEMPPSRVLSTVPTPTNWEAPMLVLRRGEQAFALQVDRLVTEQEMVIKPFGPAIKPPIFAYGCTVLGDGSLVPVIDGPAFLDDMILRGLATLPDVSEMDALAILVEQNTTAGSGKADVQRLQATTVLVVDDAVTLRRTLALSLERAGYRVLQARDGQEALEQLEQSQSIQLIICDVEMPNMNGFEFLTKRRETPQFTQIPTMMLTSRGNDKHRWLAMKLGAVDYFTKPYLEQELLGAVAKHISDRGDT